MKFDFSTNLKVLKVDLNFPVKISKLDFTTTVADDKFCDSFPNYRKNKVWYFMKIACQQTILKTILMNYHANFVIFETEAKLGIVVCCKL